MERFNLYIFCGIPFSGKTTLAKRLVKKFGFVRIDLDEVKFDLFGKNIKDEEINRSGWDKVYKEMYKRIEDNLKKGRVVINDTGNFTRYERGLLRKIAEKLNLKTATVYVKTPKTVAWERLLNNRKTGRRFDIRKEDFESTVAEMEPPTKDEKPNCF